MRLKRVGYLYLMMTVKVPLLKQNALILYTTKDYCFCKQFWILQSCLHIVKISIIPLDAVEVTFWKWDTGNEGFLFPNYNPHY